MYKIMLADDEGIVIDSLKFIIEKEFKDICEVQYAKTGRSVIELAESFRPDIAVMDRLLLYVFYAIISSSLYRTCHWQLLTDSLRKKRQPET